MRLEDKIPQGYVAIAEIGQPLRFKPKLNGDIEEYRTLIADALLGKTKYGALITRTLNPGAVQRAREVAYDNICTLLRQHHLGVMQKGEEGDYLIIEEEALPNREEEFEKFCSAMNNYLCTLGAKRKFAAYPITPVHPKSTGTTTAAQQP